MSRGRDGVLKIDHTGPLITSFGNSKLVSVIVGKRPDSNSNFEGHVCCRAQRNGFIVSGSCPIIPIGRSNNVGVNSIGKSNGVSLVINNCINACRGTPTSCCATPLHICRGGPRGIKLSKGAFPRPPSGIATIVRNSRLIVS